MLNAIDNDNFVRDQQVYNFVDGIVSQIAKSNKELIAVKPLILIDRSEVVNDTNITIYNVDQKKVMRTIPHWNGIVETSVFPAKEGHILVAQYNSKERVKRFSIESL